MHRRPRRFELLFPRWGVGPTSDFSLVDGSGRPGHLSVGWVCLAVRRLRPKTFHTIRGLAFTCFTGVWKLRAHPVLTLPRSAVASEALSPAETGEGRLQVRAVGSERGVHSVSKALGQWGLQQLTNGILKALAYSGCNSVSSQSLRQNTTSRPGVYLKSEVAQSCLTLCVTPWTVAYQASLSMGFSRQEYWSGLPFPSPGDLPDPGIKTQATRIVGRRFTLWATREAPKSYSVWTEGFRSACRWNEPHYQTQGLLRATHFRPQWGEGGIRRWRHIPPQNVCPNPLSMGCVCFSVSLWNRRLLKLM